MSARDLYQICIGLGVFAMLMSIPNLVFYFGITHRWYSLVVGFVAAFVGSVGIVSGLYLRAVLARMGRSS